MDDLLLFTPSMKSHIAKLEDLLKALLKNGLKISQKKYRLFRTELQYMGNTIFIRDRRHYVGPVVIYKIIDPHNYLLMELDGKILRGLF